MAAQGEVTELLRKLARDPTARVADQLLPLVYDELRTMAAARLRAEREGHTLSATALVHEVYLKLVDQRQTDWKNRAHFFGAAARAMRRVLVDRARARLRKKRVGRIDALPLCEVASAAGLWIGGAVVTSVDHYLNKYATAEDLYLRPQHAYTRELLASFPSLTGDAGALIR